ncbi:MAG: hypothetical protein NUV47_02520 [Patescibacteria group bacterium]|nr:hypothetical protein [Patescibacteria group bacterium]
MIDRRGYMDEGTRAIIKEITREICDTQYEKIEKITKERNEYLDEKFACVKKQIKGVEDVINEIKTENCTICLTHVTEHKEKEKRINRNVTIISTTIPTMILLGSWIKGMIISWLWMQKPPVP